MMQECEIAADYLYCVNVSEVSTPQVPYLIGHTLHGESAPHEHALLSILREDDVVKGQCSSAAHRRGLLTAAGHIERKSTLYTGIHQFMVLNDVILGIEDHKSISTLACR